MDIKKTRKFQIFSVIFTLILGTILHFTYKWSNQNPIVGLFSSINESVWEHLKLLFYPMVIATFIGLIYFKNKIPNFLCSKAVGIFVALSFTIIFFYTYSGIIGTNIAFIDIASFFIATILGEFISYVLIINKFKCNKFLSVFFLILVFFGFIIFTFYPPKIGIFKDPLLKNSMQI